MKEITIEIALHLFVESRILLWKERQKMTFIEKKSKVGIKCKNQ